MVQRERLALAAASDLLTAGYGLFVFAFVLVFRGRIASPAVHALFAGSVVLAALVCNRVREKGKALSAISVWYPVFLYPLLYHQTGLLNRVIVPRFLDEYFLSADRLVFGGFPGLALHRWIGGAAAGEAMHFFYFSYYLLIPAVGFFLYRKDARLFQRYIFEVSAVFYLCYAIFIFLPVEGPLSLRNGLFHGSGLFRHIVDFIYEKGENPGGAFPSSHVAVALIAAAWGARQFPGWKWLFLAVFVSLSIATVYCMFHYAVDVAGGVLLSGGMMILFRRTSDAAR